MDFICQICYQFRFEDIRLQGVAHILSIEIYYFNYIFILPKLQNILMDLAELNLTVTMRIDIVAQ